MYSTTNATWQFVLRPDGTRHDEFPPLQDVRSEFGLSQFRSCNSLQMNCSIRRKCRGGKVEIVGEKMCDCVLVGTQGRGENVCLDSRKLTTKSIAKLSPETLVSSSIRCVFFSLRRIYIYKHGMYLKYIIQGKAKRVANRKKKEEPLHQVAFHE